MRSRRTSSPTAPVRPTPASPAVARRTTCDISKWGWCDRRHACEGRHRTNAYAAAYVEQVNEILYFGAGARRHAGRRRQHGLLVPPGSDGRPERHAAASTASTSTVTFSSKARSRTVAGCRTSTSSSGTAAQDPHTRSPASTRAHVRSASSGTMNACAFANTATITRPWGARSEVAVLLRGRAQSERALPGPGASVLLDLHLEHAHLAGGQCRSEGLRERCDRHVRLDRDQEGHRSRAVPRRSSTSRRTSRATRHSSSPTVESQTLTSSTPGRITSREGATAAGWSFDSVSCGVGDKLVQKSGANLTIALAARSARSSAPT